MRKIVTILLSSTLLFLGCMKAEKPGTSNSDLVSAPDFILQDLEGNQIALSDYRNKVVFLNFWATWCPPCREEIPDFIKAYKDHQAEGLEIIGVSVDRDGKDKVADFAEKNKIKYPIAMATRKIVNDYQPGNYIPTTIIIDRKGKISHKHIGYMSKEVLEKYFLDLK